MTTHTHTHSEREGEIEVVNVFEKEYIDITVQNFSPWDLKQVPSMQLLGRGSPAFRVY